MDYCKSPLILILYHLNIRLQVRVHNQGASPVNYVSPYRTCMEI